MSYPLNWNCLHIFLFLCVRVTDFGIFFTISAAAAQQLASLTVTSPFTSWWPTWSPSTQVGTTLDDWWISGGGKNHQGGEDTTLRDWVFDVFRSQWYFFSLPFNSVEARKVMFYPLLLARVSLQNTKQLFLPTNVISYHHRAFFIGQRHCITCDLVAFPSCSCAHHCALV